MDSHLIDIIDGRNADDDFAMRSIAVKSPNDPEDNSPCH